MSLKRKLRKTLLYLFLVAGSVMGSPMDPQQIEDLLHLMNQTRVEVTLPDDKNRPKRGTT